MYILLSFGFWELRSGGNLLNTVCWSIVRDAMVVGNLLVNDVKLPLRFLEKMGYTVGGRVIRLCMCYPGCETRV